VPMSSCSGKSNPSTPRHHNKPTLSANAKQFLDELLVHFNQASLRDVWRYELDSQGTGCLSLVDFILICQDLGGHPHLRELWKEFDIRGRGCIGLADLDAEVGEVLGRFSAVLVAKFGNLKKAMSRLGFTGERVVECEEFCEVVRWHHLLGPRRDHQAVVLFQALCDIDRPYLIDKDFGWFLGQAPYLQQTFPLTETDDESDNDDVEEKTVFGRLYRQGLDQIQKREEMAFDQTPPDYRQPCKELFERLYKDHEQRQQRLQKLADANFREVTRTETPKKKKRDKEAFDRLTKDLQTKPRETLPTPRTPRTPKGRQGRQSSQPPPRGKMSREVRLYEDYKERIIRKNKLIEERALEREQEEEAMRNKYVGRKTDPNTFLRLYEDAAAKAKRAENEIRINEVRLNEVRDATTPRRRPQDPDWHDRLFSDRARSVEKFKCRDLLLQLAEERELKAQSVHRNVKGSGNVFDRLYVQPTLSLPNLHRQPSPLPLWRR